MAYKRSKFRRRPRRFMRKRMFRRKRSTSSYAGVRPFKLKRSTQQSIVGTTSGGAPYLFPGVPHITSFSCDRLPGWAEITNLFREYKITGVRVRFHLRRLPGAAGGLPSGQYTSGVYPQLYCTNKAFGGEFNDTHYVSINDALEDASMKVKVLSPEKPVTVYISRPSVQNLAFAESTAKYYTDRRSPWISTIDGAVGHFGGRMLIDNFTDPNQQLDVITTYYLQVRGVR